MSIFILLSTDLSVFFVFFFSFINIFELMCPLRAACFVLLQVTGWDLLTLSDIIFLTCVTGRIINPPQCNEVPMASHI